MNASVLADRLAALGLDEAGHDARRMLCASVVDGFAAFAGGDPALAFWVPGRLEIFGKHTDYGGGCSLVAAMPRGFAAVGSARADDVVRLLDARRGETVVIGASGPSPGGGLPGWHRYVHTVARRLARNFPGAPIGMDIVFASDLPSASGMSSSSALMVGVAAMLIRRAGIEARREWEANVRTAADQAGYYACIENGMSFGTLDGDSGVGTHGGSEDHVAIVCARPGRLSAWRFVPIHHVGDADLPSNWRFVIASSGVAAKKTGNAQAAYNRLSQRARALLDLWNAAAPPQPSLAAAVLSSPDAPGRLRALLRRAPGEAAELDDRLGQFIGEHARVLAALDAFRHADADRIGLLAHASQAAAETLLRNQSRETIALAASARTLGAFAASSFGAGFGGSVWALVERDAATDFAERWLADYRSRFPERAAAAFIAFPGPPLTQLV